MGVRTARRGRGLLDRPVGGAPGACVRPRRRDRAGEQGARQSSRQPRRAGLQRVRPERRGAHWVPGCYAPERAELPRAGLRLDARHLERLHELHGRRPQPRRHARGEETDLEGIRRGPAARLGGRGRRAAAMRRSTCRSSTSGVSSHARRGYAGSCRWRSSRATARPAACPTSRSSSRISATACTTARSRRETPG